jgi:hypothetical protein
MMTPALNTSHFRVYSSPRSTSGAIHAGVPTCESIKPLSCRLNLLKAKSHSLMLSCLSYSTLALLRSLCATECECRKAIPVATPLRMCAWRLSLSSRSVPSGRLARLPYSNDSSDPVINSVRMHRFGGVVQAPKKRTRLSWLRFFSRNTSLANVSVSAASSLLNRNRFTAQCIPLQTALYTCRATIDFPPVSETEAEDSSSERALNAESPHALTEYSQSTASYSWRPILYFSAESGT